MVPTGNDLFGPVYDRLEPFHDIAPVVGCQCMYHSPRGYREIRRELRLIESQCDQQYELC